MRLRALGDSNLSARRQHLAPHHLAHRAVMAVLTVAALVVIQPSPSSAVVSAAPPLLADAPLTGSASAYRPIDPIRILDTRDDALIKRVWSESSLSIDPITQTGVAAAAGVAPDQITAVIVNTTIVDAGGWGFATVWPTGSRRNATSTNNVEFAGHTKPNLVIAPIGLDHKISVYGSTTADVVLDVLGVFVASGATDAGRFEPLGPTRAYDSRLPGFTELEPEVARTIDLTAVGVPVGASGVVMNVTAINQRANGYLQVRRAGGPVPRHSNVNYTGPGDEVSNQVISGLTNGMIDISSSTGGGFIIDVTGYFSGSGGAATTDGLFVPFAPRRLLDTRESSGPTALTSGNMLTANQRFDLPVVGRSDVTITGAKAVALNLTAVNTATRGFVKTWAGGASEPPTSALNFIRTGQVVPNHAITTVGGSGSITIQPSQRTHFVVDASGYFLAAGATPRAGGASVVKTITPGAFVPSPLPASPTTAGPYDFLFDRGVARTSGRRPNPTIKAAWTTCRPLRYALNIDLAENDAQIAVVIASIEEIERSTGIDFQFAGLTSAGMNIDDDILLASPSSRFRYLPPDDAGGTVDLVIGFSDENDTGELADGVVGVGGFLREAIPPDGRAPAQRGFAVIDLTDLYFDGPTGPKTLARVQATTTHELGHMVGLGHVDGSSLDYLAGSFTLSLIKAQLMYPYVGSNPDPTLDVGDQRGLFELYANRSCSGSGSLNRDTDRFRPVDWTDVDVIKSVDDFG